VIPGDVCAVHFTNNDGSAGERPVLVLFLGPIGIGEDEVAIVAQITAEPERVANQFNGDISLEEDFALFGLRNPSVIRCRQSGGLPLSMFIRTVGNVGTAILEEAQGIFSEIVNQ
jgi:hypothetical protein